MRDVRIEWMDDDEVRETVTAHKCTGISEDCQAGSECQGCGDFADPSTPVYVWKGSDGTESSACGFCLEFEFARVVS